MTIPVELVEQFARGNGVIFVGAGLSQGSGLPGWTDLVQELASELDGCPTDVDYREIAQYYDNEYGRQRLVQRLRDRLDTLNVSPTPVHTELAKLPISVILTTNYDDLLEQALRAAKRPFIPAVGNTDVSFWSSDRLQLVKLHGDLNQPESIIITTEDYDRFASSRKSLADILKVILQTRTVLFLGYSAADPDLRLILTQARDEGGRLARNLYTVQFSPPPLTIKDLERRGLKVIDLAEQTEPVTRNAAMLTWLQALGEKFVSETLKLKPATPPQPQTAAQVLAAEIQIWLKAMGYTVISRPGDDRIIDLEATLQRGLAEQHVLVRCIAGEITVRHLEILRRDLETRNISKGWAVSDRRVPPSASVFAETNPSVRPFSLADFVSQIFNPYFGYLHRLVAESDVPKYYVDLACYRRVMDSNGQEIGRDYYQVIDAYIDDWLKARDANHLSILGEFGSGKTWFCRHYAYRQLQRYLVDPVHERLPILITLRDYIKQVEIGSLIRKLFDEQGVQLGNSLEAFEELNRQGKLLLIFDGFDEMSVKVDYQTVVDYFGELTKVVVPSSKALLTCRTSYFRYATEADKVMGGEELGRKMIVIHSPQFEVIYLEPFTDNQIHEVIMRRSRVEVAETILNNSDLKDLARQPVLIEMLMEALPDIQPNVPINKSEIYRLTMNRWLERDIGLGRTFMNKWDKLFFMVELAWEMLSTGNLKIHYKELPERINRHFELKKQDERDYYDFDIRTRSFLRRDAVGQYEFIHKSFIEYFAAYKIANTILKPDFDLTGAFEVWKPKFPTPEVKDFVAEMILNPMSLWRLIEATRGKTLNEVGCTGGNAATLLQMKGESFVGVNLAEVVLAGANLFNTDLTRANLHSASLRQTEIIGCILKDIDLGEADLTDCTFAENSGLFDVSFSPDGKSVASAGENGEIYIWSIHNGHLNIRIKAHNMEVWGIEYRPDGKVLLSNSPDGTCKVWNLPSGQVENVLNHDNNPVRGATFSPDGRYITTVSDANLKVWDAKTFQILRETEVTRRLQRVFGLFYSGDGSYIGFASSQNTIHIIDSKTHLLHQELKSSYRIREFRWNPQRYSLAAACWNGPATIWDLNNNEASSYTTLAGPALTLCYDLEGNHVAVALVLPEGKVEIWNLATHKVVLELIGHTKPVFGITYSSDGRWVATGSLDSTVRLWDIDANSSTFGQCLRVLEAKLNCQGTRISGAKGLDTLAPNGKGTLRDWLIARGAVEEW